MKPAARLPAGQNVWTPSSDCAAKLHSGNETNGAACIAAHGGKISMVDFRDGNLLIAMGHVVAPDVEGVSDRVA